MTMTTGTETVTPASVNILRKTRYGTKNYSISVGFVKDGEMPQYVVLNNETGVVEFSHEVLSFARECSTTSSSGLRILMQGSRYLRMPFLRRPTRSTKFKR